MPDTFPTPVPSPLPNVFVLSTGRCGTMTFAAACRHITNYSSAHESRVSMVGTKRLSYLPAHIEVDNRLAWFLGRLDQTYGDKAFYVHLRRDDEATARSYAGRWWPGSLGYTFAKGIYLYLPQGTDRLAVARDLVVTVNTNIAQFLRGKSNSMTVTVENAETDFARFWHWLGAEGDLTAALAEWRVRHNATPEAYTPAVDCLKRCRAIIRQCATKVCRLVGGLPEYIYRA